MAFPKDAAPTNAPETFPVSSLSGSAVARARALVLTHGWNSVCFQILNPGFAYWFSPAGDAVVGYVRDQASRVRVVGGAPVCSRERLADVIREWEAESRQAGDAVCYLCAASRLQDALGTGTAPGAAPHTTVALGAQPVWNPQRWTEIFAAQASLRQQVRRVRGKGVQVTEWGAVRAATDPGLRRCLEEWLAARRMPPLRFLAEPRTLDRLEGRRVFVATLAPGARAAATVTGFLIASPVPLRKGWLFEQVIRGADAPNGTAEMLIDGAMRAVAADGAQYVTLGLVPLSRRGGPAGGVPPSPLWLRLVLAWARAHGRRFWNFDGLESFRAKLQPDFWEPIFAIADQRRFSPRLLIALARAFHPPAGRFSAGQAFLAILADALRQECRGLLPDPRERAAPASGAP
ncbi:MAG: DUF2156 domain-containing protein [Cytophagales bacterium]|nr:DUF2156 domain-containing protein [Armatimonadota bacterium]